MAIEIAYMLFGLALCAVTATGTTLWLDKRRRRGQESVRLRASWTMVVWGTPFLIVAVYWVRVTVGPDAPLAALFCSGLAALLLLAIIRPVIGTGHHPRNLLVVSVILTAGGHMLVARPAASAVLALDLAMPVGASAMLYTTRRSGGGG